MTMQAPDILHLAGHVLDILPTLEEGSVRCCVTSPPYWGLRDYGIAPSAWPEVEYVPLPGLECSITVAAMDACLGLEASIDAYVGHLVSVFRDVRRVLTDDGTLWLNLGDSYATGAGNVGACPPALVEPCILAGSASGDTVLDPFGGSGTVGMVARRLARRAVLIDANPEYLEMQRRRVSSVNLPLPFHDEGGHAQ